MTEYHISRTYRVLGQLLAAALIICGSLIVHQAFHLDNPRGQGPMFAIGIVLASLGVWLMIGATRLCLTVDDENTPEMLEAAVVWKHIHHGKPTTYDLDLSPWYRVPAYDVHLDL